ncbi:MAG TPA: GWxTD domain-containing protein [Candidatus Eisenbacteria bacterium]|uniref:GWxTD domain-containing protein n=1 Tax=Eiseniibacteriota bacterium TaxID=2212470 RepID=A0A7V2AWD6_UNCEI|nr:GWxTD domain-containing protein [Candidatus Eisenbacteria bacterium]
MRGGLKAAIAIFLASAAVLAARARVSEAAGQAMTGTVRRPFELSVGQSIDSEGSTLLVVTTAIDYRRLVFFRQPTGYVAEYRIYIEVRDDEGKRVRGEVIEKTVTVTDYDMTRGAGMFSEVTKKIPIGSGDYRVDVSIEVVRTSLKYDSRADVTIYGREQGLFEMSDPVFSTPDNGNAGRKPPPGELSFSVCPGEIPEGYRRLTGDVFMGFEGWILMSWTVLSPVENRTGRGMEAAVKVQDLQKHMRGYTRQTFEVDSEGRGTFCVEMNVDDLPLGFYEVSAAVSIPNSTKKVVKTGTFTMLLGRAMFDRYFEDTLELLGYVADDRDIERLKSIDPDGRVDEWNRHWKSKDPTKTTDLNEELSEFLRRVRFTLENFSRHGPGWKSDMGRVYIQYGAPDNTADHDGPTLGSRLKIWYYYSKGLAFIFEDSMGSGLYRLYDTRSI